MENEIYQNPEPVPAASQLAALPFLSAVDGYLRSQANEPGLRITLHRVMSREGYSYLQQVCGYLSDGEIEWKGKVGRTFPKDWGIIGAAAGNGRIWRTKRYQNKAKVIEAMRGSAGAADASRFELSYLAIPFLASTGDPVLILYAACFELNFFAENDRIRNVVFMCNGFCRLLDNLQADSFHNLRNFPLARGEATTGDRHVFETQEALTDILPPKFNRLMSFNYEAAVA